MTARYRDGTPMPHPSLYDKPLVRVQGDMNAFERRGLSFNATIVQIAEAEYERQYGTSQTIDRLRQRGGLGMGEMMTLLAEAVCRYAPEEALTPKSLTDPAPLPKRSSS